LQQPQQPQQDEEEVRITTEEVLVPLLARDDRDRFDPTVEPDDILVLEEGIAQKVTSIRRLPASVLVVIDTTGVESRTMRTSTTREAAHAVAARLRAGDRVALIEQGARLRTLQNWTTDQTALARVLKTQLSSGTAAQSARFTDALLLAARMFATEPYGNRHVIFITDGVERFDGKGENLDQAQFAQGRIRLAATGALIHIISYTQLKPERSTLTPEANQTATVAPTQSANGLPNTVTATGDPTRAPGINRGDALGSLGTPSGIGFGFDPAMRRRRRAYAKALQASEARLASLTETVGGKLWLPVSADEMIEQSRRIAGEIAAQYTITYKPRRPFKANERRIIEVASRRVGLQLETRRRFATGRTDEP
jgi:VWFA-related protein